MQSIRKYKPDSCLKKLGIAVMVVVCLAFAASASAQKVELRFMGQSTMPTEALGALRDRIERFEKIYPNVDIVVQLVGEDEWYSKLISQHAMGDPPSMFFAEIEDAATFYYEGLIGPVTPVIERVGAANFARPTRLIIDGEDYFFPIAVTPDVLWYREDLLEEKGLGVPRTWDEWMDVVEATTEDADGDGVIDRWGVVTAMHRSPHITAWWYDLFYGAGGHVMAEQTFDKLSAKDITLDSPATRKALEFGKELFEHSPPGAVQYMLGDAIASYFSGKAATIPYEGRLFWYALKKSPIEGLADNTKATFIPTLYGYPRPSQTCFDGYVVSAGLKPDQLRYAQEFVYFQSSGENLISFLMGVPIHNLPAITTPEVLEAWKEEPVIAEYWDRVEVLLEAAKRGVSPLNEWLTPNPVTAVATTSLIIPDMVLDYIVQNKSADQVITDAVKKIEKLIVSMQEKRR